MRSMHSNNVVDAAYAAKGSRLTSATITVCAARAAKGIHEEAARRNKAK